MPHLYLHIPFCQQRCGYCDFVTNTALARVDDYLAALLIDIELLARQYAMPLRTLYIGGGTPSVLTPSQISQVVSAVTKRFGVTSGEVTVELNPESTTEDFIKALVAEGVNRISMGMQARQPKLLDILDRRGSYSDVDRAVNWLHKHGITNYNIDMIYGIPSQTLDDVKQTLASILALAPNHLSAYALKLEDGTAMAKRVQNGLITLPDDDSYADFLDCIIDTLGAHGLARYEVSNFAKTGYQSQHNLAYWQAATTLGAGLGAVYCVDNCRYHNMVALDDYLASAKRLKLPLDSAKTQQMDTAACRYEYVITSMRLSKGLNSKEFKRLFGVEFNDIYTDWIKKYTQLGVLKNKASFYYLTDHGLNISNYILSDL